MFIIAIFPTCQSKSEEKQGYSGQPTKTVRRPIFAYQISWRFILPFQSYRDLMPGAHLRQFSVTLCHCKIFSYLPSEKLGRSPWN